jgi:hypothetical protein
MYEGVISGINERNIRILLCCDLVTVVHLFD